jgi:hypothetical protein
MMNGSKNWQMVDERLEELRRLVVENWNKGEWKLAVLGLSTIKTVEQSKAVAEQMREKASEYIKTVNKLSSKHQSPE